MPSRFGIRTLQLIVIALALLVSGSALASPPYGTDEPSFQATYLQQSDFPNPVQLDNDWAAAGCEDPLASQNGCSFSGKKLWTATDPSAAAWQIHDIRWIFPDEASAQRYLQASLGELSEGFPAVSQPPTVGQDSQMYTFQGDPFGLGVTFYMYNLIFRVDNVVVKLFVSQGPDASSKALTPLMVAAMGQKAADRIRAASPGAAPVAPTPVPDPIPDPVPEPAPEPDPGTNNDDYIEEPEPKRPRRERSRPDIRGTDVRDYWRSGVDDPYFYVTGGYARAIGDFTVPVAQKLDNRFGMDISVGALLHPRVYFVFAYHRDAWEVVDVEEILVNRLEITYGLDLIALPPDWRVRPALMLLLGGGFGWGRLDSLLASTTTDPADPTPPPMVSENKGVGIGGSIGGEFALHIRLADKFELAPYAGVGLSGYNFTNDFIAEERRIEGERGFGRAVRWNVGLKIGFGGDM